MLLATLEATTLATSTTEEPVRPALNHARLARSRSKTSQASLSERLIAYRGKAEAETSARLRKLEEDLVEEG